MQTKIIEATSPQGNYGKFLLGRMDAEWGRKSVIERPIQGLALLYSLGWVPEHLWVLDLQTGEGALFRPDGLASADLNKHQIWVCPLYEEFLKWLYLQDLTDLAQLPETIEIDAPFSMQGYRRSGRS